MPVTTSDTTTPRLRGYWDKHARRYDRQMQFFDRKLFGDTRAWICRQANGQVLEVAIGTGLNLDFYPDDIQLTGVDFSPAMLDQARDRARQLGRDVDLQEGDAHALAFPDNSFDTVVCTFPLCGEHFRRRPLEQVRAQGFQVERQERFKLGIVERLAARKPATTLTG